ncbi:hypothetical protein LXL04_014282 [Taraxacum kok-saghyz]
MKGPYHGQILTVVGLDSNNGIYPVAYAVVERLTSCKVLLPPLQPHFWRKQKKEAAEYMVIFAGNGKYQAYGPWMDQCVVNLIQKICSCRNWDLTGIPCKHDVCAMFDKINNIKVCAKPEEWVYACYNINTWKEMYKYKVAPINGRNMRKKSPCTFTLTHPKHHTQVGRLKKRKRAAGDAPSQGKNLSMKFFAFTCTKCKNKGHNSRTCKG